jgi:hypothetical protein
MACANSETRAGGTAHHSVRVIYDGPSSHCDVTPQPDSLPSNRNDSLNFLRQA